MHNGADFLFAKEEKKRYYAQIMTNTYEVKIKKLPRSQVELALTIPASEFDATRTEAIRAIGKDIELPGFRKGHVPEKILLAKIGEGTVLEEMAEIAISRTYPAVLLQEHIDALGRPEVRITKIAPGNPLECIITTALFPEITLSNYKKLAAKENTVKMEVVVTDDEVAKTVQQIQMMRAKNEAQQSGEEFDEKAPLPPLDETYVKTLGDFTTVEDFTTKLRANIEKEKTREAKDKKRVAIMEAIIAHTALELPDVIIDQELLRMEDEFAQEVSRMGMDFAAYLKAVQKTKEDMHKDWRPDAEKRAKVQLITSRIAEIEHIEPEKETLERELAALRTQYPDANEDRARSYLTMLLTNEAVFQFLESQTA